MGYNKRAIKCSVCAAAPRIRLEIEEGLVKGISVRDLSDKSGCSKSAIGRHKVEHLPADVSANTKRIQMLTEAQKAARAAVEGTPFDDADVLSGQIVLNPEPKERDEVLLPVLRAAQPIKIIPGEFLSSLSNPDPPENTDDFKKVIWDIAVGQGKIAKDAKLAHSDRVASSATDKALNAVVILAKAFGFINDNPAADNRQVNIFANLGSDRLQRALEIITEDDDNTFDG